MRILRVFGICLIIVTLATSIQAARGRSEREAREDKAEARSSESRSSSDRHSGSTDRRISSSSYSSSHGNSSWSAKEGSRSYSAYRPSNMSTHTEAKTASAKTSTQTYSGHRYSGTLDSKSSIGSTYTGSATRYKASTYRPDTEKTEIKRDTTDTSMHNVYSRYRADSGDHSSKTARSTSSSGTFSGYNAARKYEGKGSGDSRDHNNSGITGYHPDNKLTHKSSTSGDRGHSSYKPSESHSITKFPTTQSIRDRKLAEARMAGRTYYKPTTYKPQYTYSHYKAPSSYKPPTYRYGRYHYSHTHYTRPCTFGFWSFDYYPSYCRRSLYYHYGLFPYIQITRIIVSSYPRVVYVGDPIYVYGSRYEFDRYPGLDQALADIRSAWMSGRLDLLDRHVSDSRDIAILLDGRYDYSVSPDDYVEMTEDALGEMDTVSFVWDKVRTRGDGDVTAFATHTYRTRGSTHRVHVSYTLDRAGSYYFITEVGSSQDRWY